MQTKDYIECINHIQPVKLRVFNKILAIYIQYITSDY